MAEQTFGEVRFTEETWQQIVEYTELCSTEVAAMGYVKLDGPVAVVDEVFLVPQVVSGASVEFVETGFPWAVNKAIQEGRLDELRFCWHSHVNFAARFSDIDKEMIRKVHNSGPIPWFVSTILNKKGETWAQIDYFATGGELEEFCTHVTLPLDVQVGEPIEYDLTEREEELVKFLTKKPSTVKTTTTHSKDHGKSKATLADEKLDSKDETVGPSGCTGADWKLHNLAKNKGWASYIDPEHYVHYWDENDGNKYKGCAPMPTNPDGSWKLNIEPSVIDSTTVDEIEDAFGPRDDDDVERMVQQVMERDQL